MLKEYAHRLHGRPADEKLMLVRHTSDETLAPRNGKRAALDVMLPDGLVGLLINPVLTEWIVARAP